MKSMLTVALLIGLAAPRLAGQEVSTVTGPVPDPRMKADILLIVAHPDDETAIGSLLARLVYDDQKRIAIVYCNRGTGGGNNAGNEQSNALGLIRETEARRAAASFGIWNVWFLSGRDTPGQDLFQSLQNWHHGTLLEEVVRVIRLTRPEVIFTWLPHYVSGENHGDHQAAGVIATEAFDCAGDATVFPAQVASPRERTDIGNANEGLLPWQTKKIYYFSDASHKVSAPGPAFDLSVRSKTQGVEYYRLAARLHLPHATQGDVSSAVATAESTGTFDDFRTWLSRFALIFGKSVVGTAPTDEIFAGVTSTPSPYHPVRGYQAPSRTGVSIVPGGVFAFYRDFWRAHEIDHIGPLVGREVELGVNGYLHIPLELSNATRDTVEVELTPVVPGGWKAAVGAGRYRILPGEVVPVQTFFQAPGTVPGSVQRVGWTARAGSRQIGDCTFSVTLQEWTLPQ